MKYIEQMVKLIIPLSVLLLFTTATVFAAPVPKAPIVLPGQSYGFSHVIESGDMLFLAAYEIDWDTDLYSPTDAIASLTDYSNNLINAEIKHPPYLPGGLVGFYLTADEVTSLSLINGTSEVRVLIRSNPTSFDDFKSSSVTGNINWVTSVDIATTLELLEPRLITLVANVQANFTNDVLVENNKITAAGAQLALAAFTPLLDLVPDAFSISDHDLLTNQPNPDTTTPLEDQINTDNAGSKAFLGLTGFADGIGIDRDALGFGIVLMISIPIFYVARQRFNSLTLAFSATGGLLVWWAAIGMIPIEVIFLLDILMIAVIGVFIWRQVPTN